MVNTSLLYMCPPAPTNQGMRATTGADLERSYIQKPQNAALKDVWSEVAQPTSSTTVVRPAPPTTPKPTDDSLGDVSQHMAFHPSWVMDGASREKLTEILAQLPDQTNAEYNERKSKEGSALFSAWTNWQEKHHRTTTTPNPTTLPPQRPTIRVQEQPTNEAEQARAQKVVEYMMRQTTSLPSPEAIPQARERTSQLAQDYMKLVKLAERELANSAEDAWDQILDNFPPQARHILDPRSKARSNMPTVETSGHPPTSTDIILHIIRKYKGETRMGYSQWVLQDSPLPPDHDTFTISNTRWDQPQDTSDEETQSSTSTRSKQLFRDNEALFKRFCPDIADVDPEAVQLNSLYAHCPSNPAIHYTRQGSLWDIVTFLSEMAAREAGTIADILYAYTLLPIVLTRQRRHSTTREQQRTEQHSTARKRFHEQALLLAPAIGMQAPASDRTSQNRRRTPQYRILKAHLHEIIATRLMFNQLYGYHDNAMTQYIEDNQSSRMRTTFDERLPQRYDTQQEQELLYPEPTATHLCTIQPPHWVMARADYQCTGYALDTTTNQRIPCGRVRRAISH